MKKQKSKRLVLAIIGSVLLFLLMSWGCCRFIRIVSNSLYREVENNLSETTMQGSNALKKSIQSDLSSVISVANTIKQTNFENSNELSLFLSAFVGDNQFFRLSVADVSGRAITSDFREFDATADEAFNSCMAGETYISAPFADQFSGEEIMTFASPIKDSAGKVQGYISGSKLLRDANEVLKLSFCNGQGHASIIDREGKFLFHPDHTGRDAYLTNIFETIEANESANKLRRALRTGNPGVVSVTIGQTEQLLGYTPIEGVNDWYTLTIVPLDALSVRTHSIIRSALLLCLVTITLLVGAFGVIFFMSHSSRKRIARLAYQDPVTKGRNWNALLRDAPELIAHNRRKTYALVLINIDKFKFINDRFGFDEGNNILKFLSETLDRHMQPGELSVRSGGDRFVAMLHYNNEEQLVTRLKEIWTELSLYQNERVAPHQIVLACGIYLFENTVDLNIAYDRALLALNSVKGNHENIYAFYTEQLRSTILHEKEIENEMHSALKMQEFVVYLQPKFRLSDERLAGAEALVRWKHPERGLIPPDNFIPLFEKNGFIVDIDLFVFRDVCRMIRRWIDSGVEPLPVSVNISRVHLHNPNFVEELKAILEQNRVPSRLIELELTESIFFENITIMLGIMKKLKQIGFVLSMDDFGSGYSSLNLLKAIPVDVLKIDKEFLTLSDDDSRSQKIVSGVISIARQLGIKVLTEGVETREQANFLKEARCEYVQGYFFSKPLPMNEFEVFMKNKR